MLIVAKSPCRMSFAGGGSDLPQYYRQFGGKVISAAIDLHVITLLDAADGAGCAPSDNTASFLSPLVCECVRHLDLEPSITAKLRVASTTTSRGSGLGGSSALVVSVLKALYQLQGRVSEPYILAEEGAYIEMIRCGMPVGKQDHYAAAFGGINVFTFNEDDTVSVEPICCNRITVERLNKQVGLYFTGRTRQAKSILYAQQQQLRTDDRISQLTRSLVRLVDAVKEMLKAGDVLGLGEVLHESWLIKRQLSKSVTNDDLDCLYMRARASGALGGKLLGAGGGGFFILVSSEDGHIRIKREVPSLIRVPFALEWNGAVSSILP